ncbi:MAG TPA: hypothetical protein VE866_18555 [Candidatus Binatia bacterium]|jgi:hypothetical protein|nr:hypothetical protein [Candidatus Binatia bacterium]
MKTNRLTKKMAVQLSAILLLTFHCWGQEQSAQPLPDWSKRTFSAAPAEVFAAAIKSIAAQHHEVKSKDEANKVVSFHVGTTAWSWGYNMVMKVATGEDNASNVSIEIARSGGKTVSWGSGKKEVLKIFQGIEKELAKAPPAETK